MAKLKTIRSLYFVGQAGSMLIQTSKQAAEASDISCHPFIVLYRSVRSQPEQNFKNAHLLLWSSWNKSVSFLKKKKTNKQKQAVPYLSIRAPESDLVESVVAQECLFISICSPSISLRQPCAQKKTFIWGQQCVNVK